MTMDWVTVAATIVIALAAVTSAWITWRLSQDNRALRQAGTEPSVVAYLRMAPRHGLPEFVVANVGEGPAFKVTIRFVVDAAEFARKGVEQQANVDQAIATVLPQGEKHVRFFAGREVFGDFPLKPFEVKVRSENLRGVKAEDSFLLDVSDFMGYANIRTKTVHDIANTLESMHREIGHMTTGFRRLHVETITTAEQQEKDKQWLEGDKAQAADETTGGDRSDQPASTQRN